MTIDLYLWPAGLPLPLLNGQTIDHEDGVNRETAASGRVRPIPQFRRPPVKMPLKLQFTQAQRDVFFGWYFRVLNNGTATFSMPVQVGDQVITHQVQFIAKPAETRTGRLSTISTQIQVFGMHYLDENETISAILEVDNAAQQMIDGLDAAVTDYTTPDE